MVELTALVVIESLLRATDYGATPIIRRLARNQAKAFLATTPPPPAVSDDVRVMREAISQALQCTPFIRDSGLGHIEIGYDCGEPWEILRAALARTGGAA